MGEVLDPMHHGYEPFGAPHAKIDSICDSFLLETIGHVADILLFNIVEVVEGIEACFSANGCSLVPNPQPDPIETLVHNNIWIDHSRHVVHIVSCLWNGGEKGK